MLMICRRLLDSDSLPSSFVPELTEAVKKGYNNRDKINPANRDAINPAKRDALNPAKRTEMVRTRTEMIRTRTWILCIAVVAAVSLAAGLFLMKQKTAKVTALITQEGEVLERIDLNGVAQGYSFTVRTRDGGFNTIEVQPGKIRVPEANCPDQICVHQGWSNGGMPIVCLPHELMITFEGSRELDAVTG